METTETKDLLQFQAIQSGWIKAMIAIWIMAQLPILAGIMLAMNFVPSVDLPKWVPFLGSFSLFVVVFQLFFGTFLNPIHFLQEYKQRNILGYCAVYFKNILGEIEYRILKHVELTSYSIEDSKEIWLLKLSLGGWFKKSGIQSYARSTQPMKIEVLEVMGDNKFPCDNKVRLLYTDLNGHMITIYADKLAELLSRSVVEVSEIIYYHTRIEKQLIKMNDIVNEKDARNREVEDKLKHEQSMNLNYFALTNRLKKLLGVAASAMWITRQTVKSKKVEKVRKQLMDEVVKFPEVIQELANEGYELPPIPGQKKPQAKAA